MAHTITDLIPTMYEALDEVSREQVGFTRAVAKNSSAERAALNQSILVPITEEGTPADNTPAVNAPDTGDQTIDNVEIKITKSKHIPVRWDGEQTKGMQNAGTYGTTLADQFAQAFRSLTNMIEIDLATTALDASRAYGTPGTPPFGTAGNLADIAQIGKILTDNGAMGGPRRLVMSSAAIANMKGIQSGLFQVNEAGTEELLRRGTIAELQGFGLGESAGITTHTKGTGAGYTSDTAGYAVGATSITLITGAGTVLAGDTVTFAGDTNKYVVKTGVAAPGVIVLQNPGLRAPLAASAVAMTIGDSFTPSLGFTQNAIQLVTRAPAMPEGGDAGMDSTMVTDPLSGITFEVALYKQFLQNVFHVRIAWGWQTIKGENIALLLG